MLCLLPLFVACSMHFAALYYTGKKDVLSVSFLMPIERLRSVAGKFFFSKTVQFSLVEAENFCVNFAIALFLHFSHQFHSIQQLI